MLILKKAGIKTVTYYDTAGRWGIEERPMRSGESKYVIQDYYRGWKSDFLDTLDEAIKLLSKKSRLPVKIQDV